LNFIKKIKENIDFNIRLKFSTYKIFNFDYTNLNIVNKSNNYKYNLINLDLYTSCNIHIYNTLFEKLVIKKYYRRYLMKDDLLGSAKRLIKLKVLSKIFSKNININNNIYKLKYSIIPKKYKINKSYKWSSYLFYFLKKFYIFFRKLMLFKNINENYAFKFNYIKTFYNLWLYLILCFKYILYNNKFNYINIFYIIKFNLLSKLIEVDNLDKPKKKIKKIYKFSYLYKIHKNFKFKFKSKNRNYFFNNKLHLYSNQKKDMIEAEKKDMIEAAEQQRIEAANQNIKKFRSYKIYG